MQMRKINRAGLFIKSERRLRITTALLSLMALFMVTFEASPALIASAATNPDFSNSAFQTNWNRTDYPVDQGKALRSYYWGPKPVSIGLMENYADSPGGKREVQYFDKARMEINNPSKNQVTNGLLVVELINGRRQEGDKTFTDGGPASIPIAGDPDNAWPTYAGLGGIYLKAQPLNIGQPVAYSWTPNGQITQPLYKTDPATAIAVKQNGLGIPAAFWNFMNLNGTIYNGTDYQTDTISNFLFSTGLPVTEAYWTKVKVGGVMKDVMFQAFERRTLTYTPSNPASFQVEMGNVGLHYISWRYPKGLPQVSNPVAATFLNKQPEWYEVTGDVLNVRTAPNTSAPQPERTQTLPFLQMLYKGNHIQPIRAVKGEEIEKGNDTWLQFYEKPDLFVYSGYVKKLAMPDFPTPPQSHRGVWVSVDLSRQMMAVFENNRLLYKTLIASGVPNADDPTKDHRTPTGVYKIDGSYRPASQTMKGGEGDRAAGGDYYELNDIRNVSYFFEDYSVHGTYWHARFGTYPQSHGCVNATVYDAGLIYGLPAGTVVDIFRENSATAQRTDW